MKLRRRILAAFALIVSAGCVSMPKSEPVDPAPARRVAALSEERLPTSFEAMHAVRVEIKPHWWWPTIRQVALSCSRVDRRSRACDMTCFSPLGVTLFRISFTNGATGGALLLPVVKNDRPAIHALGAAIAFGYLDMKPGPDLSAVRRGDNMIMTEMAGKQRTDFTFSASTCLLASKVVFVGGRRLMTVSYDDYRTTGSRSFPGLMTLTDHRNGYKMVFILKEFREVTDEPGSN